MLISAKLLTTAACVLISSFPFKAQAAEAKENDMNLILSAAAKAQGEATKEFVAMFPRAILEVAP